MVEVVLTAVARADLKEAWSRGAEHWSIARADRYALRLEAAILGLCDNPRLGQASDLGHELRRLVVERHVAYYRVTADAVIILRVLHGAMEATGHLRQED